MKKLVYIPLLLASMLAGCSFEFPALPDEGPSPTPAATAAPSATPAARRNYDSLDSSGTGWGFVRKKGAEPELPAAQIKTLEDNGGYYLDHSGAKNLYLTFDEGYENGFTAKILDILSEKNVPAAFFVTGPYLEGQPELIRRMIDDGHIVGNHTVNHLNLPKQTVDTVRTELDSLNKTCEELYGYTMSYMRPPEGEYSEKVLAIAQDMGYKTIMWSMAYKDWDVSIQNGPQYAYDNVVSYLHPGAVILLHAVSSDNAAALGDIIDTARQAGYEFKSLSDL